jgi:DNA-binding GntR family transcriptional regulator
MEEPATRTEQAYRTIREQIICLDLLPGATFSEALMANSLGVSKTPIREALVRLQREGFVEVTARSGYRVSNVTLKDALDLFSVRLVLEAEAADLAAKRLSDPEALGPLKDLCTVQYDGSDSEGIRRYFRATTQFHTGVALLGGNTRLAGMLRQVIEEMERLFHVGATLSAGAGTNSSDHEELLEAIKARDPAGAKSIAISHCESLQGFIKSALLSSSALLEANIWPGPIVADGAPSRRSTYRAETRQLAGKRGG